MPRRPPRFCGCGAVVSAGQRCACQIIGDRARKARHDANRPSARARGYTAEWQRERDLFLQVNPTCKRCGKLASVVDHVIPHKGDRWKFWNRSNWQALCGPCHNGHKQRVERREELA